MSETLDFEQLVGLCRRAHQETQRSSAHAVDRYLVTRNWLFGWYIVEYEQSGADRARYGAALARRLADKLTVRGCSSRSLALSRKFYRRYAEILQTPSAESPTMPADQQFHARRPTSGFPVARGELPPIVQTPSAQLASHTPADDAPAPRSSVSDQPAPLLPVVSPSLEEVIALLADRFTLGWSHYVTLLTLDNAEARCFYEIEATVNGWSVRELERQISSSLYERLALSRDKANVPRLAREGHVVEKAADLTTEDELPTVGIVLCGSKNDAVVELTLPEGANIYASKYQLYLPSKQDLAAQLKTIQKELNYWKDEDDE